MFLLFDCNNFFASCEQVFRPDWRRRPLVVLSNNDGCVISRSPEAKQIGIAMGEPYFKCRERLERARAIVCSANFSLYSDLSDRIMRILEAHLPSLQQYSIDEAFAEVSSAENAGSGIDWADLARKLRRRIRRWTGVTVSVGMAPTRTLVKLANETAKHRTESRGFMALLSPADWEPLLEQTPVSEVWGVGRRLTPRLHALGIRTAAGLASTDLERLRRSFGVHGERLALELRGISCLSDEPEAERGQIMVSRSLKEGITELCTLRESLCRFVEKAARTLRRHELMARNVFVILRTSRYEDTSMTYANSLGRTLPAPGDDTRLITRAAVELLEAIYQPGYRYKKIGVILTGLEAVDAVHPTFEHPDIKPDPLMKVLDQLQEAGHDIHFANRGSSVPWHCDHVSRRYTTRWEDIPEAW